MLKWHEGLTGETDGVETHCGWLFAISVCRCLKMLSEMALFVGG